MSEAEIKNLCMELYLLHGEREFICSGEEFMILFGGRYISWAEPNNKISQTLHLTPKALELIREE